VRHLLFLFIGTAACTGPGTYGDPTSDRQIPPRGSDDILTWLEAGYYKEWHCEDGPQPRGTRGGHNSNRICNNDLLYSAREGEGLFRVGAASVKEVFSSTSSTTIALYAVYRKVTPSEGGDSWYWYEGAADDVIANGEGDDTCTGCHARAARDFVFTIIPRTE
jgi:hypothetical protein